MIELSKPKVLVIAEKPSLMKEIKAVYDKHSHSIPFDMDFERFVGHITTLQQPKEYNPSWENWDMAQLPMLPEEFVFTPSDDKVKIFNDLKHRANSGDYDFIFNACDTGREGEAIFWFFMKTAGIKLPAKRLWWSDFTETAFLNALQSPREYTDKRLIGMRDASFSRAHIDWLIGMNFSRAYGLVTKKKAPLGRVMTPMLNIVVQRDLEINNFVPKPFWEVEGDFGSYSGIYFDEYNETQFLKKDKAEALIKKLGKQGTVIDVTETPDTKFAPELHSLSNLQNECNARFGYTMTETLAIAQSLYEKKLLSYPRTDSAHLTKAISGNFPKMLSTILSVPEIQKEVQDVIDNPAQIKKTADNKKYVNDKKVSDHYAITPTIEKPVLSRLTPEEVNVYTLVAKRFLSIFLPPQKMMKTVILTESNGEKFKTNGSTLIDLGFMRLYGSKTSSSTLPKVKKGDVLDLVEARLLEKKTTPPKRFTDASLNSILENVSRLIENDELSDVMKEKKGIGTPATRGGILEKLMALKMLERKGKSIVSTNYGVSIIQGLGDLDIKSPELTAVWEQKLSEMEEMTYKPSEFDKEMRIYISETVYKLKKLKVSIASDKPSLGKCPKCGGNIIDGKSFYLCENYKNTCDVIIGHELWGAKITKTELKKILDGKETKEFNFKKDSKEWKAKLIFDKAQGKLIFANGNGKANNKSSSSAKVVGKCPKCGSDVVETDSYYKCSKYKDTCDFIISKEISGAKITLKDVKALLSGKTTDEKEFTWKSSGKKGKAKLKYNNNKLEFVFSKR